MAEETEAARRGDPQGTVTTNVADALTDIILGQMVPGAQLPSESDLARRFEVSRLTVREAVKMLAGRGLLDVARGRRAVVREPDGSVFADFVGSLIRSDPKGLFDLIELRMSLETMSARLAARRASRAALQSLENAMEGMRRSAEEYRNGVDPDVADRRFQDHDLQFHEALATASGNRILAFLFESMSKSLRESFRMSSRGQAMRGSSREDTLAAHQAVLDAVRAGKELAAAEAMRVHLSETESDVRSHLSDRVHIRGPAE